MLPFGAQAQTREIRFPPVGSGEWWGSVFVGGIYDETFDDAGENLVSFKRVELEPSNLFFDLEVDKNGKVTRGEVQVDLRWRDLWENGFVITQRQTGTLTLSGTAGRLVASGVLTYNHKCPMCAEGHQDTTDKVDTVWVFAATDAKCVTVGGPLVEFQGMGVMAYALFTYSFDENYDDEGNVVPGSERTGVSTIVSGFRVFAEGVEYPEAVEEALKQVDSEASLLLGLSVPQVHHFSELLAAWDTLNRELARLDACQEEIVGFVPQSEHSWLTDIIRKALNTALDNLDAYDVQDVLALWTVGFREKAMDGALVVRFSDAIKLELLPDSVSRRDVDDVRDIATWADRYNAVRTYELARHALEQLGAEP